MTFAIDQRVKVCIQDHERYAMGCADKLDNKIGVIEEAKEHSANSRTGNGPAFLVRFDTPAESWWGNGTAASAFWFDPCDLMGWY